MPDSGLLIFVLAVALSYGYAFVGGFTDAANAIATAVGTRALTPRQAVLAAGVLEIAGALTGTAVALTIGKGVIEPSLLTQGAVVAALLGAMSWSLLTYWRGIPVSETHGLIGGILGVGLFAGGPASVEWGSLLKVLVAIIVSPVLGFGGAMLFLVIIYRLFHDARRAPALRWTRRLQRLSCLYMAFSHGRNDAQKPMGVLAMALAVHYGWAELRVPLWVILSVGVVAGLGVATGGWRIIRTLGMRVTDLSMEQGFAAETAAATVLQVASYFGIPVSTTHAISSAILGAGTVRGRRSVRWTLVAEIALSWILTLPATIALGYVFAWVLAFAGV